MTGPAVTLDEEASKKLIELLEPLIEKAKVDGAQIALSQMIHIAGLEHRATVDVDTLRFAYEQWGKSRAGG